MTGVLAVRKKSAGCVFALVANTSSNATLIYNFFIRRVLLSGALPSRAMPLFRLSLGRWFSRCDCTAR